ncbi:hypothetical protein BDN70DRAFT_931795 [Pholiota conissans]|uniref:Uncharacterized protein n=1 Tax=Pholiota conissans TaxID=109636 RepID=A0A9P6D253_9AGAR|nr:hypothetical protein BDN70DRAFT_931795 [Pholiota conissans]
MNFLKEFELEFEFALPLVRQVPRPINHHRTIMKFSNLYFVHFALLFHQAMCEPIPQSDVTIKCTANGALPCPVGQYCCTKPQPTPTTAVVFGFCVPDTVLCIIPNV